jgi:hypothetical protein
MNYHVNPSQQGDLDSLCGIYSLVNAMSYLYHGKIKRRSLMRKLIDKHQQHACTATLLTEGMDGEQLYFLITQVLQSDDFQRRFPISVSSPFTSSKKVSIKQLIKKIINFFNTYDDITERIVLIGSELHWTLIFHIDHHFIYYFDSTYLKKGYIRSLTLSPGYGYRSIIPQYIYFLSRKEGGVI